MEPERVTETRRIYEGRILNLRVDDIEMPDGTSSKREIVEHGDSVCVIAIDDDENLVLVRQFRLAIEGDLLEIPAGGMEPGETPEEAAKRELREETGREAADWTSFGGFYIAPGYTGEFLHLFLARGLTLTDDDQDEDEAVEVELHPLSAIKDLIAKGELRDAKSVAGLLQAGVLGKE